MTLLIKEYFIVGAGRVVVLSQGFHEREVAESLAQELAKTHPGSTFSVMLKLASYQFPRKRKTDP